MVFWLGYPIRRLMRISSRTVFVLLAVSASADAALAQARAANERAAVQARALATQYLAAHNARYPESDAANFDGLFDNSLRAYEAWSASEALFLERLRIIARNLASGSSEALTLALLRERLEMSQQFRVCRRELWNVGPLTGWLNEYRGYAAQQPAASEAMREAALRRWRKLPAFIDTEIANLRAGVRAGHTAPRMLVTAAIAQTDAVIALPATQSPFYAPASRDTAQKFRAAFESLVRDSITPALRRYRNYLADEYSPRARASVGLVANPGGAACFRALIRRYTTLDISPSRLNADGRALIALGDANALRLRQQQLIADTANRFSTSRAAMAVMADALARAGAALPQWFGRLPTVLVPNVDSMPDAGDSDPDAMYVPGSGSEPPRVYVNIPRLLQRGGMLYAERLAFHEGVPGHHVQVALQRSADTHPLTRVLWNAAFGEGWAVYASNLALEMGLYSSDATRFAALKSSVDDGLTYVVQYGLHAQGWTREQAVDTLRKYSGGSADEATQQVEYFIAAPAHALAYPLGARYIADLRRDVARRLGPRFDVRKFHDVVLESGALPLGVLTASVNRWAQLERSATP